jgi:hypothetical protein
MVTQPLHPFLTASFLSPSNPNCKKNKRNFEVDSCKQQGAYSVHSTVGNPRNWICVDRTKWVLRIFEDAERNLN